MNETEKNVMCVLLQRLLDKNLITPKIFENARGRILDSPDCPVFFCNCADDGKEKTHGSAQNPR